ANQLGRQPRQPLELGLGPPARIVHVFAVDVAELFKRFSECDGWSAIRWACAVSQKADAPDLRRFLRLAGEWRRKQASRNSEYERPSIHRLFTSSTNKLPIYI